MSSLRNDEITPRMIAAGLGALPYLPEGALLDLSEEMLVSQVYEAMRAEAPLHDPSPRGNIETFEQGEQCS